MAILFLPLVAAAAAAALTVSKLALVLVGVVVVVVVSMDGNGGGKGVVNEVRGKQSMLGGGGVIAPILVAEEMAKSIEGTKRGGGERGVAAAAAGSFG